MSNKFGSHHHLWEAASQNLNCETKKGKSVTFSLQEFFSLSTLVSVVVPKLSLLSKTVQDKISMVNTSNAVIRLKHSPLQLKYCIIETSCLLGGAHCIGNPGGWGWRGH